MRKAFFCLATGVFALISAGYLADTARSDARVTALGGAFSVDRASKGDRLPAFAVNAIRGGDALDLGKMHEPNLTMVERRSAPVTTDKDVEKRSLPAASESREADRDAQNASRGKKRNKMMDGCEASVSPLSPASAQARASRCVA
jgi:hypothetical protein